MNNSLQNNILCPNSELYEDGAYRWSAKKIATAWNKAYQKLGKELSEIEGGRLLMVVGLPSSGKSTYLNMEADNLEYDVIFDGGFITRISRAAVLNLCVGAGWEVDAVLVDTPPQVSSARNKKNYNRQRVPLGLFSKLTETLEEPSEAEGFSEVFRVSMNKPWAEIKSYVSPRPDESELE